MAEYDSSFRTWQAVGDLVHHAGPLAKLHFGALARASGLTPRQVGDALALLRDDGFRFQRDETLALLDGLEHLAIAGEQGFDLAVVILLADLLQTRRASPFLVDVWPDAARRLKLWPATLRAAVANGLVRAGELGLVALEYVPKPEDCLTRGRVEIAEQLLQIARSLRPDELWAVARADEGREADRHLAALQDDIRHRDGIFLAGENRLPRVVVELSGCGPDYPGFAGCTAILLLNVLKGEGKDGWSDVQWANLSQDYVRLRPSARDPIFAALRWLYEADRDFWTWSKIDFRDGPTIPVVDEL